MNLLQKIGEVIKSPIKMWLFFANRGFFDYLDDDNYLKIRYRCIMGEKLDLDNPLTFNEKLQWLKIHDHNPIYESMVDKVLVKDFVAKSIGEEHVIPTIGIWDSFDDINFDELPNEFVIKCTHDSGSTFVIKDKNNINYKKIRSDIAKKLKKNFYRFGREWPYKNIKHRVIVEKYMSDKSDKWNNTIFNKGLIDYKFYCFNGEPKFLYVSYGMDNHDKAVVSFVSLEWELLPFYRLDYKLFSELPPRPNCFEEMISICRRLAKNTHFLRVDLYEVNDKVYFSEMTFYPCSGFMPLNDKKYDVEMGKYLSL